MNTLVLNLGNLAVTEYTAPFTGLAGDIETTADGVYAAGGDDDDGAQIEAQAAFGLALAAGGRRQRARYLYAWIDGGKGIRASVTTSAGQTYEYLGDERHGRVLRFILGAGIIDNYLQFGLRNALGKPFTIDLLEIETSESKTRRL